jgi:hypothetical protein
LETPAPKKSKKNGQHVVPRTYLKHWKIAEGKNFVYGIDFSNKYKKGVQTFGLNDVVFKELKYYNSNSFENPYIIEDILGKDIEPIYEDIMAEINLETNLSVRVREEIMQWLYFSKMRSPVMRKNTERLANFIYKTTELYKTKKLSLEKEGDIEELAKRIAKDTHLNSFTYDDQSKSILSLFFETLNAKHWRILKSIPQLEFWTNDNPGFSPNLEERFAKDFPYHYIMEMSAHSIIFYPLSPKYCLEITPFSAATPLETCAMTMEIKYEKASIKLIDFINKGVFHTCNKVLISRNKEILEYCIKS